MPPGDGPPFEVNGHAFETDPRRTARLRDVRVLRCTRCGETARVSMRSREPIEILLGDLNLHPCHEARGNR